MTIGTDLLVKQETQIAVFTQEQTQLIKRTLMPQGATLDDLQLFLAQCSRTRLDPFARQIYCSKIDGKLMIQSTIDGLRIIAERSGKYAGQVGPYWCGENGDWKEVWLEECPPHAAKVGVLRNDFAKPLWAVARFDSYAKVTKEGKLMYQWRTMGDLMIAKCAEALALRKAFPQDLSGIYSQDEMDQATPAPVEAHTVDAETGEVIRPVTPDEWLKLKNLGEKNGWNTLYVKNWIRENRKIFEPRNVYEQGLYKFAEPCKEPLFLDTKDESYSLGPHGDAAQDAYGREEADHEYGGPDAEDF